MEQVAPPKRQHTSETFSHEFKLSRCKLPTKLPFLSRYLKFIQHFEPRPISAQPGNGTNLLKIVLPL